MSESVTVAAKATTTTTTTTSTTTTTTTTAAPTTKTNATNATNATHATNSVATNSVANQNQDDEPVVGTKVDEHHSHYVLMHDMLCGIRTVLSRLHAKRSRPLKDDDFTASHKLAFDITGNEMTPSSRYDFKFKDYAPWVFRSLRDHFKIDPADYIVSLTGKYVLSELGSPGKSGSFFYFSRDYRFIIKTISHTEHVFFREILRHYYEYCVANPNTLLARFFGLYRVKLSGGRKIPFVIMGNIFPPNRDIHETFDLKGSLVGRYVDPKKKKSGFPIVLKDLNFQQSEKKLLLGPAKREIFLEQIQKDSAFLASMNIMDYSLLLGIHDKNIGNSEQVREHILLVVDSHHTTVSSSTDSISKKKRKELKKEIKQTEAVALSPTQLPKALPKERKLCIFYQDEGGFQSTDENNMPRPIIYHMGIIDILTPYDFKKKIEHSFKSIGNDPTLISAVPPALYAERFTKFLVDGVGTIKSKPKKKKSRKRTSTIEEEPAASTSEQTDQAAASSGATTETTSTAGAGVGTIAEETSASGAIVEETSATTATTGEEPQN